MKIKIIQDIIDLCRRKILFRDLFLYNFYHNKLTEKQMRSVLNLSKKLNKFKITIDKKTDMLLCNNKNISFYVDPYYPVIAREIFGDNIYELRDNNLNKNEKYTVLDIGANHGYASLYFAEKPWCENVYAFELVPEIAKYAEDNFKLNKNLKNKMNLFSFGLGKNNEETFAFSDGRDYAVSLSKECILKTSKNPDLIKKNKIYIKQTSTVLKKIIKTNNIKNIIIKIDVEGAEYDIMEDIVNNYPELLKKTIKIFGETHLGFEKFMKILPKNKFKCVWKEEHNNGTCPFELSRV